MTAEQFLKETDYETIQHESGECMYVPNAIQVMEEYGTLKYNEALELAAKQVSGWPTQIKLESEIIDDILKLRK